MQLYCTKVNLFYFPENAFSTRADRKKSEDSLRSSVLLIALNWSENNIIDSLFYVFSAVEQ
jgi:hypothetical protein